MFLVAWALLYNIERAGFLGVTDFVMFGCILFFILIRLGITFGKGEPTELFEFHKWQVFTVKSICESEDGESYLIVVRTKPGEDMCLSVSVNDHMEDDGETRQLRVGYHYRYDGEKLIPLPVGKAALATATA